MITVANPGQLVFTDGYAAVFAGDRFTPQLALAAADGSPLVGLGAATCATSGEIVNANGSGCELTTAGAGDGVVTVSSSGVSATLTLRVVQASDVRRIDFGMLTKNGGGDIPHVRVIAQTDVGAARGGAFQCSSDGIDQYLNLDAQPVSGAGL